MTNIDLANKSVKSQLIMRRSSPKSFSSVKEEEFIFGHLRRRQIMFFLGLLQKTLLKLVSTSKYNDEIDAAKCV